MRCADIEWTEDGTPKSRYYGDVYFSTSGGPDETRHVFMRHNGLPERFSSARSFTIAETGFGTGLNFLAAWQAFVAHAPHDAVLHYISAELHPLHGADMARAHHLWPELTAFSEELHARYPLPVPGVQRVQLTHGRVLLTLFFGDVKEMFSALDFHADAWFLDGFSPARNPQMWEETVLRQLPSFSAPGATFATFTAAGHVKRTLTEAGFIVHKAPGFGHKRDMLHGTLVNGNATLSGHTAHDVAIIGAGAAGAAAAYGLANRGMRVTIIDRQAAPAMETSANPAAILFPFASRAWMPQTSLYLSGLNFTRQQIGALRTSGHAIAGEFCGMIQCPKPSQVEEKLLEIPKLLELDPAVVHAVTASEAAEICGLPLPTGALYWPGSGYLSLSDYTHACLSHPNIRFINGCEISLLRREAREWTLSSAQHEIIRCPVVILANAASCRTLLPESPLPLREVRGQITHIPITPATRALRTVLCYGGYMLPAQQGQHTLGATYERDTLHTNVLHESHRTNLLAARKLLHLPAYDKGTLSGWAARRTTTPDKLPLVGALHEDLYLSVGHGSRGALSCPLSGELLAATITGEAAPLAHDLTRHLDPKRFVND